MKTIRVLKNRFCESLYLPYLIIGVAGITLLCFFSQLFTDVSGEKYTIIQFLLKNNKKELSLNNSISYYTIINAGMNGWIETFGPAFLTMSYALQTSAEYKNRALNYTLPREGLKNYVTTKLVSCVISGGIILALGFLTFCILCIPFQGDLMPADKDNLKVIFYGLDANNKAMFYIYRFIRLFLLGMYLTIPGIISCIFFKDRYILFFLPVLISYIYSQSLNYLISKAIYKQDFNMINKLQKISFNNIKMIPNNKQLLLYFALLIVCITTLILLCYFVVKRRNRRGTYA